MRCAASRDAPAPVALSPMAALRPTSVPIRRLAALFGLLAVLTMHVLTMPAGHGTSEARRHADASMATDAAGQHGSSHGADGHSAESHGLGSSCAVIVLSAVAALVVCRFTKRWSGHLSESLLSLSWRPDPPVPRFSFAT
jgi:hypothetical protein